MSETENQQIDVDQERPELVTHQVSSTSAQTEVNSDEENGELNDDPINGCDSTTEVNESLIEADNQETTVESTSQTCDDGENTLDSTAKTETSSLDDNYKSEEHPQTSESTTDIPKTSRELKSILALSKEAKLDTNLSTHRRKNPDKTKGSPKKAMKITNFPVTAESELENFDVKYEEKPEKKVTKKRKASLVEGVTEGATNEETRRSLQGFSGEFVMLKKPNKDVFCWRCHHDSVQIACETCPRAYHLKCLKQTITDMEHWPCPECVAILKAENTQTRSKAMKGMSLEHLCNLLKFAVKRMIQCTGSEPFIHPVDEKQFPEYRSYIIQPMTLSTLEKNIKDNLYGSTQAFEADAKWILHNSIIFNSYQSKLTTAAKTIVKICKQEMAEIENCPSCYLNANTKKHTWFIEVCPKPHLLVWAKLKGFPYWPAKVMSINSSGMADVRFFGAHDKAWVSVKDCFLYSVKDPNSGKQKRNDIIECVKELELYVDNLREIYGRVNFAPFKTPLEPDSQLKQLQVFLPNYRHEGKEINKKMKDGGRIDKILTKAVSNESLNDDEIENNSSESDEGDEEEEDDEEDEEIKNRSGESTNGSKKSPKEGSMTRIDYRDDPADKSKLLTKPIQPVVIRKRYSTDSMSDNMPKIPRRDSNKNDSVRLSVDSHVKSREDEEIKSKESNEEEKTKSSPQTKLKIADQLIKKLEDLGDKEEEEEGDNEEEEETKEKESSGDNDIDDDQKIEIIEEKPSEIICDNPIMEQPKKHIEETKRTELEKEDIMNESPKVEEEEKKDDENEAKIEEKLAEKISEVDGSSVIEEDKKSETAKDFEMDLDETNIRNIIHSSLIPNSENTSNDEAENKKKRKREETEEQEKSEEKEDNEESNLFPPNKMVKLVPIENILQKKNEVETTNKTEQLIVLKEIRMVKDGKEATNKNENNETYTNKIKEASLKIKNEVESDEDNNDVQYMEAKRQYLSALNISEKQSVPAKPKAHEIRTRSKTEEKKSKSIDNLSKVIEDVATRSCDSPTVNNKTEPVKEIYIKSLSKMQTPKHKARKSFPTPNYNKKTVVARKLIPKSGLDDELTLVNATTLQPLNSGGNVMILPKLHYNKPIHVNRDMSSPPVLTMLPRSSDSTTNKKVAEGSQNYIPQNEEESGHSGSSGGILLNNLLTSGTVNVPPIIDVDGQSNQIDSELGTLKEILPENVSKGVSEILCQPPPKLKPKPLGVLNSVVDSGVPSTAGPVASRINSMAQKLAEYFRGLLVETISDLGKNNNPEATISSLKYEIEELNHKHGIELAEIRRNVSIVLKDIQKSVVEERERIINETKANCEMEMMKRVEEAKSKQWCANCSKEAQFYCCWNTSYCDYPCQQKHWLKHMSKCTQTASQNQTTTTPVRSSGQQLVLTPTSAPKFGTLFAKPQKVYLKRASAPFKQTTGSHITLVESTPGNFELLGSGPIAVNGKILASTSVIEKIKSGNIVTVTAPSGTSNTQLTSANQKVKLVSKSTASSSDSEH